MPLPTMKFVLCAMLFQPMVCHGSSLRPLRPRLMPLIASNLLQAEKSSEKVPLIGRGGTPEDPEPNDMLEILAGPHNSLFSDKKVHTNENQDHDIKINAGPHVVRPLPRSLSMDHVNRVLQQTHEWTLMAENIGENIQYNVGPMAQNLEISRDGTTLVSYANDVHIIKVFRKTSDGKWVQLGQDLPSRATQKHYLTTFSLSTNGSILAIGTGSANSWWGMVRIFNYNDSSQEWDLVKTFNGEAANQKLSQAPLSADGSIVAMSTPVDAGLFVRVFENVGNNNWQKIGDDIRYHFDYASATHFGTYVDLSSDGSVVAVGGRNSLAEAFALVFKRIENTWQVLGQEIKAITAEVGEQGVHIISLSGDGSTIAIGMPPVEQVRVFRYKESEWQQIGQTIDAGSDSIGGFGRKVHLSENGSFLIVESVHNAAITVFELVSSNGSVFWEQLGQTIPSYPKATMVDDGPILVTEVSGRIDFYELTKLGADFDWNVTSLETWSVAFNEASSGSEIVGKFEMAIGKHFLFEVFKADCTTAIGGDDAITVVGATGTVPSDGIVDAKINIDPSKLSALPLDVYSDDADGITKIINVCVKASLKTGDGDEDISVNFHETLLSIFVNMAMGFEVENIVTERDAAKNTTQAVNTTYDIQRFLCPEGDINNATTWTDVGSKDDYRQGDLLKVCITVPNPDVYPKEIASFKIEQVDKENGDSSVMIGDNAVGGGILAASKCEDSKCMIQTMIPSDYFDDINNGTQSPYDLKGAGTVVLAFGSSSTRHLLIGGDETGLESRSLQQFGSSAAGSGGDAAVSSQFEVSVGLVGGTKGQEDNGDAAASSAASVGRKFGVAGLLLSFFGLSGAFAWMML